MDCSRYRKTGRQEEDKEYKKDGRNRLAKVLMLTGILMIGYGIFRGEVTVVYTKAIQICLECIGIG